MQKYEPIIFKVVRASKNDTKVVAIDVLNINSRNLLEQVSVDKSKSLKIQLIVT
jgi:hypothetical protein